MSADDKEKKWKIELLGVRGSMAVTPEEYREFGSDTTCIRLSIDDKVIFLDAGSGIMYGTAGAENHILIGHPHLDHLLGLCKWKELADPSKKMKIYMADHCGEDCETILKKLYGPPFWPIHLDDVSKGLEYVPIRGAFEIGGLKVDVLAGNHPGGVTHFRISDGTRSLVYAVDSELTKEAEDELASFAEGCDLLFCDGQFFENEAEEKKGWGHSSMAQAAALGARCHANHTILMHFDPFSTDEQLREEEKKIREQYPQCTFGRQGAVCYL